MQDGLFKAINRITIIWVFYVLFEVRNLTLDRARKIFGVGIGKSESE